MSTQTSHLDKGVFLDLFERETFDFTRAARLYLWKYVLGTFMVTHILKDVSD